MGREVDCPEHRRGQVIVLPVTTRGLGSQCLDAGDFAPHLIDAGLMTATCGQTKGPRWLARESIRFGSFGCCTATFCLMLH